MRLKLTACGLLMVLAAAGCSGVQYKCGDPATPPAKSADVKPKCGAESQPSPAVEKPAPEQAAPSFETVVANQLPTQVSQWTESSVQIPGATVEVVGEYLYVMASAGMRNSGGYSIKISNVEVKDDVVKVQAHLGVPAPGQGVTAAITYPKDFARVRFTGTKAPQAELDLVGAAKGNPIAEAPPQTAAPKPESTAPKASSPTGEVQFQSVDPKILPKELQGWAQGARGEAGISGQIADASLYLQVFAGEQPTGGYRIEIRKVELLEGAVRVQAVLHKPAPGTMVTQAITYPKGFVQVSYSGTAVPKLELAWVK